MASDSPDKSEIPNPQSEIPVPATKTVRTFKSRNEGEAALAWLEKEGISASLLELAALPGSARTAPEAVRLVVDSEDAARAESSLKNQHRLQKESLSKTDAGLQRRERERQRYSRDRVAKPVKRGFDISSGVVISLALLGAFGAVVYMISRYMGEKKEEEAAAAPKPRYANLDLNGDRKMDHKRYLSAQGRPIREEQDLNYDGKFDAVQYYDDGRMNEMRVDLDGNGQYDEFFYFDYLGRPFYSQIIMNGKGGVSKRTYYQEEVAFDDYVWPDELDGDPADIPEGGDCWPFWVLTASKSDGVFETLEIYDSKGQVKEKRVLAPGAKESQAPVFPKPPVR